MYVLSTYIRSLMSSVSWTFAVLKHGIFAKDFSFSLALAGNVIPLSKLEIEFILTQHQLSGILYGSYPGTTNACSSFSSIVRLAAFVFFAMFIPPMSVTLIHGQHFSAGQQLLQAER